MTDTPMPGHPYLTQDEAVRLKTILEGTGAGTWEWNVQTGETIFNRRWAEIIGYSLEELQPISINTWMKFAHPDDLERSARLLQAHFSGESNSYRCEARMRHKDGHWVWVRDYGRLVSRTPDGEPEWVCGTHIDISDSKNTEEQLKAIQIEQAETIERFEKMASLVPGVVYQFEIRPDGGMRFPYASAGIAHIYNVTADQVLEDASVVFDAIHPEDRPQVQQSIELSRSTGEDWIAEYRVVNKGETHWVFGRARPEFLGDGAVLWHGVILDISAQKNLEAQLRQIATTDELTDTANRRHFMDLLSNEYQRYKRRGPDYSLILFDFDWFKKINDQYGHGVGDLVLKSVAHRVQSQLRSGDTIGRIGGEEFAILLPQTHEDEACQLAERLRKSVEILEYPSVDGLRSTITCGIAASRSSDIEPSQIILRADKAMYRGKAEGRNRVVVFQPSAEDNV